MTPEATGNSRQETEAAMRAGYLREYADRLTALSLSFILALAALIVRLQIGREFFGVVLSVTAAALVTPLAGNFVTMILQIETPNDEEGRK